VITIVITGQRREALDAANKIGTMFGTGGKVVRRYDQHVTPVLPETIPACDIAIIIKKD